MVFTVPNHVESSMCVRYFAPSSLRTEDPTSSIAYSQLIPPFPRGIKQAIFCQHQWKVFQLMIHADSCQIVLAKTFLEDVSGSLSNQIQTERA